MKVKALLTGSRAYGEPTEDSDIDIVLLVPEYAMPFLHKFRAYPAPEGYGFRDTQMANLMIGNLNLICYSNEEIFNVWKECTDELIARKPVTREEAVELIQAKRDPIIEKINAEADAKLKPNKYIVAASGRRWGKAHALELARLGVEQVSQPDDDIPF